MVLICVNEFKSLLDFLFILLLYVTQVMILESYELGITLTNWNVTKCEYVHDRMLQILKGHDLSSMYA